MLSGMIVRRFWAEEEVAVRIGGRDERVRILRGSDLSLDDARAAVRRAAGELERRVREGSPRAAYQAEIREHVVRLTGDGDAVTVNRYGALVLNTVRVGIYDFDRPVPGLRNAWDALRGVPPKQRILARLHAGLPCPALGTDFRIYETAAGIRVIGRLAADPRAAAVGRALAGLGVDGLYATLSAQQGCWRARLTPKPYRLGIRPIRIRSPVQCQGDEYRSWSLGYLEAARGRTVARLVGRIGGDFADHPTVALHDEAGLAGSGPLA
jgi:hypothetical protein